LLSTIVGKIIHHPWSCSTGSRRCCPDIVSYLWARRHPTRYTTSISIVSHIRPGTPSPVVVSHLWARTTSATKSWGWCGDTHLCHWNGFRAPFRRGCRYAIFDCTWYRTTVGIVITGHGGWVVSVRLIRVEMRQWRDGVRVGSNALVKVRGGVVVCKR